MEGGTRKSWNLLGTKCGSGAPNNSTNPLKLRGEEEKPAPAPAKAEAKDGPGPIEGSLQCHQLHGVLENGPFAMDFRIKT